jgi:hypothetical protein
LLLPLSSSSCHGFGGFICWVWFLFSHHAFLSVVVSGSLLWLHRFSFSMVFSGSSDGLFPYIQLLFVFGSVLALIFSDCFQIYRDLQVFKCHVCLKRIGAAA